MRIVLSGIIGAALVTTGLSAQQTPVHIFPPTYGRVEGDSSASAQASQLLLAYLKRRFDALGVKLKSTDSAYVVELHFIVLPLKTAGYDVAATFTLCECLPPESFTQLRTPPMDWAVYHSQKDLETVARDLAEKTFTTIQVADRLRKTARP